MSLGTIVALVLTVYISTFLLIYFLASIYVEVNWDRLRAKYLENDIGSIFWLTVIAWPISLPLWLVIFLGSGFTTSISGVLAWLDNLAEIVAEKIKK